MKVRNRWADLGRGLLYALLLDTGAIWLTWLAGGSGLVWALGLVWAMVALAVTGIAIMEERYLIAGGFWLLQVGVFTLALAGYIKVLSILCSGGGCS